MKAAPFHISWLRTQTLAIGAQPSCEEHWLTLEQAGIRSVLCTTHPNEGNWCPPDQWRSTRIPLTDHRNTEELDQKALNQAIDEAICLMTQAPALYLHCLAGIERSALVAIGILARWNQLDLFTSLEQVRRMHPPTRPLIRHLVVLDQVLRQP